MSVTGDEHRYAEEELKHGMRGSVSRQLVYATGV